MNVPDPDPPMVPAAAPEQRSSGEPRPDPAPAPGTVPPPGLTPPPDLTATLTFTSPPGLTPPPAFGPPPDLTPTAFMPPGQTSPAFLPPATAPAPTAPPGYATPGAFPAPPGYPAARVFPAPSGPPGPAGYRALSGMPPTLEEWPAPPSCDIPMPRRRRWPVPVLVAAVLIAAGAGVYAAGRRSPGPSPAALAGAAPAGTPVATPDPSPADTLDGLLQAQAQALLAGDERAFMATVDPAAKKAVTAYRRLYRNLRALHVTVWHPAALGGRDRVTGKVTAQVSVVFCLVRPDCRGVATTLTVTVAPHRDGPLLEAYTPPARSYRGWEPYPWETSRLHVVEGARVVLAATDDEASHLASVLPVAERAAVVADRYARWGKPTKYLVYLAGHQESPVWFGGMTRNAIGEEVPVGIDDSEVIILLPDSLYDSGPGGIRVTIQHEMGHVATLLGARDTNEDSLVEGMAQYIAYDGHPSWAAGYLYSVNRYLRSGRWSGQCYLTKEINLDNVNVSNAAYGIGYLMVKYLVDRYGRDKTLEFFADVVRYGDTLDYASREDFRTGWKTVNAGCAGYVHHAANA